MNRNVHSLALMGTILLAACGRPDQTASDTSAVAAGDGAGACSYLSEAEATAALGSPSRYRSDDGGANCIVDPVTEGAGPSVDFTVQNGTDMFDLQTGQTDSQPVPGLGDRAVWVSGGSIMGTLVAVKGTRELSVSVSDMTGKEQDLRGKAEAVARTVLPKV